MARRQEFKIKDKFKKKIKYYGQKLKKKNFIN